MQLGKTQRASQLMQSLQAEGELILDDAPHTVSQSKSSLPPTDPITLAIEERLNIIIKRDGGISNFDVQGTLSLHILNQEDGLIQFQIENQEIPGLSFKTHPNINKELFNNNHVIGLKDPNRPFPTGQNDVSLMKWRIHGMDESSVPLTVNCWPSVSGRETSVNIEYEASEMFDLQNVVISIPLPATREAPNVLQIDGEWRYDSRSSTLVWSILLIDNTNRSGSMEFVLPPADPSAFFPINISFTAAKTFSDAKVGCERHSFERWSSTEVCPENTACHGHVPSCVINRLDEDPNRMKISYVCWLLQVRECHSKGLSIAAALAGKDVATFITLDHLPIFYSDASFRILFHRGAAHADPDFDEEEAAAPADAPPPPPIHPPGPAHPDYPHDDIIQCLDRLETRLDSHVAQQHQEHESDMKWFREPFTSIDH
ncbi:hypothetical protein IEQ34_001099 [Dendrobium chrysotoxum]|uniref:Coatomer subunit delta n=1 Tax=Dendrobium chrysotoxum TaxID=161865 RepID=A0AAV7HKS3_DENCH|nr:hypothetical protein IEQ34_001099 [Dendrobium chrysotoxum]